MQWYTWERRIWKFADAVLYAAFHEKSAKMVGLERDEK
jgi:hypothetical protein